MGSIVESCSIKVLYEIKRLEYTSGNYGIQKEVFVINFINVELAQ